MNAISHTAQSRMSSRKDAKCMTLPMVETIVQKLDQVAKNAKEAKNVAPVADALCKHFLISLAVGRHTDVSEIQERAKQMVAAISYKEWFVEPMYLANVSRLLFSPQPVRST